MLRLFLLIFAIIPIRPTWANVTGSDLQNFNAITSGLDFVTVHSSETLIPGIANFGFFANYAVNTLPRYSNEVDAAARTNEINDSILATDFNFGLGITKTLDIGFSLPFVVSQEVNLEGARGEFESTGLTEIRGNLKYRLIGGASGGIATIVSFNQNLTENNPFTGTDPGPILNFELAFDTTLYTTAMALNIGYRMRNSGDAVPGFPIEPLEDQFIASAAVSQLFSSIDTKIILEVFTATPVSESDTTANRSVSASEALLGFKFDWNRNTAIHLGASTELDNGTASPDWRAYTGINYVTGNYKNKKVKLVSKKKKKKKKKPKKTGQQPIPIPEPEPPQLPTNLSMGGDDYPPELPGIGDDVFVLRDVNFAFDSAYKVLAGAKTAISSLAQHLRARGYRKIIIEGHTDSIGSEDYNIKLGRRRSETIKRYMVEVEKIDPSKIKVLTYGEYRPVADNGNYQGRQLNRRVVFRILYPK